MTSRILTARCLAIVVLLGLGTACAKRNNDTAGDGNAAPADTRANPAGVGAGVNAPAGEVQLMVAPGGLAITDARGRAVYFLEGPDGTPIVECVGECATAFDPVTGKAIVATGDTAVQIALISDIPTATGQQQVTYNGKPLYYMKNDQGGAQPPTTGNIRASRVSPSGKKVSGSGNQ